MKKSLLLALTFAAACGYAMAEEDVTTTVPAETAPVEVPAQEEAQMPEQTEDTLDMDELLGDETEEAK